MMKFGNISEIDAAKGLARVKFEDDDNLVSDWLPVAVLKSKYDLYSYAFDVDERVCCLMDPDCETGVVLCAVYDKKTQPDGGNADKLRVKFKDGTAIEYDRSAHKLTVECKGDVTVKADTTVTIEAPNSQIKGKLTVTDDVVMQKKLDVTGVVTGAADIKAGGGTVTLLTHKHTTAAPGSPTSPPTP